MHDCYMTNKMIAAQKPERTLRRAFLFQCAII